MLRQAALLLKQLIGLPGIRPIRLKLLDSSLSSPIQMGWFVGGIIHFQLILGNIGNSRFLQIFSGKNKKEKVDGLVYILCK